MKQEKSVTDSLVREYFKQKTKDRRWQGVTSSWKEVSDKFDNFNEALGSYISEVRPVWSKIATILGGLSTKEINELKDIQPNVRYLTKYKLLTLSSKRPKPGDVFVDLTEPESVCVWSPSDPEKFKSWRSGDRSQMRHFKIENDLSRLLVEGKIEDLPRFVPKNFINSVMVQFAVDLRKN